MGRPPRIDLENYWYHIVARGNDKKSIFRAADDYRYYLDLLDEALSGGGGKLGAYCLMPNHIHLLILRGEKALSNIIHQVHSKYSRAFNSFYGRVGHLFQGRYKSFMVLDDRYLETLLIYIHENPRKAKLVKNHETYRWSSEKYYLGANPEYEFMISIPGFEGRNRSLHYQKLLESYKGATFPINQSFIGTAEDMKKVDRRKYVKKQYCRTERRGKKSIEEIASSMAEKYGILIKDLRAKGRTRKISALRKTIIQEMIREGHGPTDVGRFFNRDPAYIVRVYQQESQ